MLRGMSKQRGMTGLGWLTVLFLIGFFVFLAFKLVPIYLEHHSVESVLVSLKDEPLITKKTVPQVRNIILTRLNTNGVRDIGPKDIKISKKPGVLNVAIGYEVRKDMVGNIDILVSFDDKVELVSN
jgi:hypothetical protein